MRFSEDRIYNLCHKIHDRLYLDEMVDYTDEDEALRVIKNTVINYLSMDDQIDNFVRDKVKSLRKGVFEGSPEWEVLYRKYYEEELRRKNI